MFDIPIWERTSPYSMWKLGKTGQFSPKYCRFIFFLFYNMILLNYLGTLHNCSVPTRQLRCSTDKETTLVNDFFLIFFLFQINIYYFTASLQRVTGKSPGVGDRPVCRVHSMIDAVFALSSAVTCTVLL